MALDLSIVSLKNQSYSEQELDIVRRSRHTCTEKLQVLQDEIRRLRCDAERLEVQIHRFDIALAPHNKSPFEMLLRIFELCCDKPAQIPAQNGSIYTISHVCSLWRQIALSTPEFWANVSIKLSRAGNHPRSLKFMDSGYRAGGLSVGELLLRKLVIHYPCRKLHLSLPHTQVTPFIEWLNGPFSDYLEVLDIDFTRTLWDERRPHLVAIAPTKRLKNLLHVRLAGMCDFQNIIPVIPLKQLQYITLLFWIPYPNCLNILSECASLVHCRIDVHDIIDYGFKVPTSSARRPVTLPALRVLRLFFRPAVYGSDGSHVEKMIQFLSVPRLCHLTLGQKVRANMTNYLGTTAICELLQRSNGMPDLVSLDLGLKTRTPIDVQALLTKTPRLRLLHVRSGAFDEKRSGTKLLTSSEWSNCVIGLQARPSSITPNRSRNSQASHFPAIVIYEAFSNLLFLEND
ncbi:hypothetical protein JOM56_001813 [Amanita muscaria]